MTRTSPERLSPGELGRKTDYIIHKFLTTHVLDFDETEDLHRLDKVLLRNNIRSIIRREMNRRALLEGSNSQRPPNVAGYKRSSTKRRKTSLKKKKKNKKSRRK